MLQPNLFTVIIRHPECPPAIVQGLDLSGITAVALGAHPVKSVEAFPANWFDGKLHAKDIEDRATQGILAHARPGGFDVEFIGAGPTPKWADEVIRALDYTKRMEREIKRLAKMQPPKVADRATARAVDILSHAADKELFELEQRARLVGA